MIDTIIGSPQVGQAFIWVSPLSLFRRGWLSAPTTADRLPDLDGGLVHPVDGYGMVDACHAPKAFAARSFVAWQCWGAVLVVDRPVGAGDLLELVDDHDGVTD